MYVYPHPHPHTHTHACTHTTPHPSLLSAYAGRYIRLAIFGVRGSPERDISSLRAFGPGGRPILRVVRAACALLEVFREKFDFAYTK